MFQAENTVSCQALEEKKHDSGLALFMFLADHTNHTMLFQKSARVDVSKFDPEF